MGIKHLNSNFDLTPNQVASLAVRRKERTAVHNANQYKGMREVDLEGYLARQRRQQATYRQNSADKKADNYKRWAANALASERRRCELCAVFCTNQWELDRHNNSRKHKIQVKRAAEVKLKHLCVTRGN